jgi:hypothetical protein
MFVYQDKICLWNMLKSLNKVSILEKEIKKLHMQQCY